MMTENINNGGAIVAATENHKTLVPVTVEELKEQITIIQRAMRDLMKDDTHFGVVPGCGKKKVLLKPGAELILTLFRIAVDPQIEEITDGFDVRYRVTVRGFHIPTGNTVGYGVGEASTSEKKYKWRAVVCHEEWEDTPETRRQIAYLKEYGKGVVRAEQVRQNPADILNTVLKMAKKRALVDLCLTATACSDIFVQDIDDPDTADAVGAHDAPPATRYTPPRRSEEPVTPPPSGGGGVAIDTISEPQRKRLYALGKQSGLSDEELGYIVFSLTGVNRSADIKRDQYEAVCSAVGNAKPGSVLPREE